MDYALLIEICCPAAKYRGSLTANTRAAYDAIVWLDERPKPTDAELAAAQVAKAAQEAAAAAISGIYAPVEFEGKFYSIDREQRMDYELGKQSRNRGKLNRAAVFATDGTALKLSTPADLDRFHAALEDAITARTHAAHDAI